jgi:hypothetical protein
VRRLFQQRAPDLRAPCPGPRCRPERGGQLSVRRNRSRKSANILPERSGQAPRRREALTERQCGKRGEFSCNRRARRRVREACRQRFPRAPCRRCGRWHRHRAKQLRAQGRTARERTGATRPQRKDPRSHHRQWRNPHDLEERGGRDGNQRSRAARPRDELCGAWHFFDAEGMSGVSRVSAAACYGSRRRWRRAARSESEIFNAFWR